MKTKNKTIGGLAMNQENKYIEVDIRELFALLLKKSWIILVCIILVSSAVGFYSYTRLTDYYIANATVYLGKEGLTGSIDLGVISLNNQLMSDYIYLIRSRLVAEEVIKRMEIDIPAEIIQAGISAYTPTDLKVSTRMFVVTYQSTNPEFAADVVNYTCEVLLEKADSIFGVKNAQIIDRALVPSYPVGPNRKKFVLIGAAVGAALGLLIIFILELLNYTFKKPEDIERILGLNVLGVIPLFKGEKK